MSRIRTIKPEWWTRGEVLECSLNSRLLYLGMNNFADDFGNIEGSPLSIKAMVFPGDPMPVDEVVDMLNELCLNDLLTEYTVDKNGKAKTYYNITTFLEDQRIEKKGKARCPEYNPDMKVPVSVSEDSPPVPGGSSKGREGKGNSIKPSLSKVSKFDLAFAQMMIDQISTLLPKHNFMGATKEKWGNVVRLMREADKLTEQEIEAVWQWAHKNEFWQSNILSPSKLREKFSQLKLKMEADKPGKSAGQAYDGIPKQEEVEVSHNDIVATIKDKFNYANEYLDDPEMPAPNDIWLKMVVGNLVLEYSERWPKGPYMRQFDKSLQELSDRVVEYGE